MGLVGTVVDAAIGWLVQSILGNLFTGQMEAWTREVGLAEDVKNLKIEMESVEMVLAAAAGRRFDNEPLARKLDDLKELLYDAEDVMDELDYYRLQQQIEGKRNAAGTNPEENYVSSSTPSSTFQLVRSWASHDRKRKREEEPTHSTMLPLENKHDISKRIDGILNCLRSIRESVKVVLQLEISHPIATSNQSMSVARNTRLTTSVPVECRVYGRDAERDMIIELLVNGNSSDLHVLPIVGSGGFGKTTLARFVYRDQRIRSHFDLHIWVCVSTNFNEVSLTREILDHLCKDSKEYEKKNNFNVLQEILSENIINKRFLLVLDDMWEDKNKSGWDKLLAPLKHNQVTGCMVLATTRRNSVARMIGTMEAIKLNGLDEKEFWLFFKACAFGDENYEDNPSLQSIGQQIAKALKGCPLAARSVGALLNRNVSCDHWRTVQYKWKYLQQEDDDILPILKISYDYLPFHLQRCFSYCSLFPEDHRFNGEVLVRAWISQNFVQCEDTSKGLEETGRQYLNSLVDFGFFQMVDSHYAMHDLMHELAEQVSSNECAKINGLQSKTIKPCIRHLSIITTGCDRDEHANFPSEKFKKILQMIRPLQKLRTLMFFGQSSVHLLRSFPTLWKEAKTLRLLRVYATGADDGSILSILQPYHLRYLEFVYVYNNTAFPQALTTFYHLQVLDAGISGNLSLPTGMNNLVNLRHLIAHEKVHRAIPCVSNMTSLQELKFKVQNAGNFEIRQLQAMNQLVTLGISQLENVKNKEDASGASLIDKEHLEELSLSWDNSSMSLEPTTERTRDVLEGLEPHQNLKHLRITGYSGATSPTWLASNVSVTSLQILHLENCKEWRILGSLEMLPLLRKLTLVRMWNLTEVSIPSLEELVLIKMPKLEKYFGTYGVESTFHLRVSSLRTLTIRDCPNLIVSHPLPPSALISELSIQGVPTFPTMKMSWRHLTIESNELSVPDDKILAFHNLRGITSLGIQNCPNLVSLSSECFSQLTALETLCIQNCPNLVSLSFEGFRQLINLRALEIIKCGNLLSSYTILGDIHEDSRAQANCPLLPSLTRLIICSCGIAGKWLTKMLPHSLEELDLQDCPQIKSISIYQPRQVEESSSLASSSECLAVSTTCLAQDEYLLFIQSDVFLSLKIFYIDCCPELQFCGSKEGFGAFVSLAELSILSCPKLLLSADERFFLPSSLIELWIQHLPTKLQPYFPDNHTSLRQLEVGESPNLESLRLESCTALEELEIRGCEQLAVLEGSQFPCSLRILNMCNVGLKSLRLESCTALEELEIKECEQLAVLEGSQFPCSLRILRMCNVDLKSLRLESCTSLKELEIKDCEQLAVLEGLQFLSSLRILNMHTVGLKSLRLESCTALEVLTIRGCEQLAVLEGSQFPRSLRSLVIEMNPDLSAAWDRGSQEQNEGSDHARLILPSVEMLWIYDLREEILPCFLAEAPSLSILEVSESPNLTSLQLGSCTALVRLTIRDCESLNSLNSLQSLGNLTYLGVWRCPRVQIGGYELCHRLETLEIDDPSALTTSFCERLTSLQSLSIRRGEVTRQLTDEQEEALQQLTSLQVLVFSDCSNLVDLPAGLHSLPSLKRLVMSNCKGISRLPEKGLPPSLEKLEITYCSEELNAHCRMLATSMLEVTIYCEPVN